MSNRADIDALVYLLNRVEEEPDPLERLSTIAAMTKVFERRRIEILRQSSHVAHQEGYSLREIGEAAASHFYTVRDWIRDYRYLNGITDVIPKHRRRGPWRENLWRGQEPPPIWGQKASGGQE